METRARRRAEALFAEFTKQVKSAADDPIPEEKQSPNEEPSRASGPKTLHLPDDARSPSEGGDVTRPYGRRKPAKTGKSS